MRHSALVHGDDRVEAGSDRGWPETDAAKLRMPDRVGCAIRLWFMGDDRVEAGSDRGWPGTDAAKLRMPDRVGCAIRLWFMVMGASRPLLVIPTRSIPALVAGRRH